MFFRMIFGLPGAAIITALLFLAMGWMIRQEGEIGKPPLRVESIIPKIEESEPTPTPPRQQPPDLPTAPKIEFPKPIGPGPGVPTGPIAGPTGDGTGPIALPVGTPPSVTFAPIYPENCRARGAQGIVMVEFDVTADGAVVNPRVVASENSCLDRAAIQTISKWKFSPKTDSDGRAVAQRGLRQTFNFQLTE